jgi:hypothetical protein
MRYESTVIPLRAAWCSPFLRWQGPAADIDSLELARQVTATALGQRGVQWPVQELVLGLPVTGDSMLVTAERVAREGGFAKSELDELTLRRYEQYTDALAESRAFQRDWLVPVKLEGVA